MKVRTHLWKGIALALLLSLVLTTAGIAASFDKSIAWNGINGTDSLHCEKVGEGPRTKDGWMHWVLTGAKGVTDAQLVINGTDAYSPEEKDSTTIHFYTPFYDLEGLTAVVYYNGKLTNQAKLVISDYCPVVYDPLVAEKTANGSYDRTVDWKLEKSVDPASHEGFAGELAGSSTWTVVATKNETFDNYYVTGTITISNSNDIPVDFEVDDVLDDGTVAEVTCPAYTVPALGEVECSYEAFPTGGTATKNTAVVTSLTQYVDGATAEAPFTYVETLYGYDSGILSDERFDYKETISASTTETFPEDFYCPSDASLYVDGEYKYIEPNTAYLDSGIGLSAYAEVEVICKLPALKVSKTAAGEWDRKVTWELDKSVDKDFFSGKPGDIFSSIWTVVATKNVDGPKNFRVNGTITVTNPASIPQTFTVKDVLDDGTEADVSCSAYTVPAKGSVECSYTAKPADASAKLNTATVTAPGNKPQTGTAEVTWKENLTGVDEGKLTDVRFGYEETISASTTETFPEGFECPTDVTLYDSNGFYSFEVTNTAKLVVDVTLEDSAKVTVECRRVFHGETAWAANGDVYGQLPYPGSNWATYVEYAPKTVTLFAGQTHPAGTVTFSAPVDGKVTITINLVDEWLFNPSKGVTLHVQDYALAPTVTNPAPGQFAYTAACTGNTCSIEVPLNNFYGVHAEVGYWE